MIRGCQEFAPDQGYVLVYLSNESAVMTEVYFDDLTITVNEHPVIQSDDFMPFGMTFNSYQRVTAKQNDFLYNGIEREKELDLGWDLAEFRSYSPELGRFMQIDPIIKEHESPYAWNTNNPILYPDPSGADSTQRANALAQAQAHIDKKKDGDQYLMGAKGAPGSKTDCSGLVSNCVVAGGEKDPNRGDGSSGVVNIENNTQKVEESEAVSGNIVTFRKSKGYKYHTGMVKSIERDKDGKITKVTYIHSSSGIGANESTFEVGNSSSLSISGFYKWDTKPDPVVSQQKNSSVRELTRYQKVPSWAKSNLATGLIYFIMTGTDPKTGYNPYKQ